MWCSKRDVKGHIHVGLHGFWFYADPVICHVCFASLICVAF